MVTKMLVHFWLELDQHAVFVSPRERIYVLDVREAVPLPALGDDVWLQGKRYRILRREWKMDFPWMSEKALTGEHRLGVDVLVEIFLQKLEG